MSAPSPQRRKLLFVVNDASFFLSHRLPLALAAQAAGHEVYVATPDSPMASAIQRHGLQFHPIYLHRSSTHVWRELRSIQSLVTLYRRLQPDLVHHVTIKPVLYGGVAARLVRVPAVVHAVPGLGHVFGQKGVKAAMLRAVIRRLYRLAFSHSRVKVIFQNPDDRALLERMRLVRAGDSVLIRGAGVDMDRFSPHPEPEGTPVVILAARMLWTKGVGEFVDAARALREQKVEARFVLVGESDPGNPGAVPVWQLGEWHESGVVEWWGACGDMPRVFAESHIVCLPSYYPEGVPKVLIEAAACGRPIVTTDTPGCREVVRHEENGLLVPPRDSAALAAALRRLILSPALRAFLGQRGREIAVAEFGLDRVVEQTLAVYRELLEEEGREAVAASG